MPKIDETRPFIPVHIAVLTVSDTRGLADDKSGDTLATMIVADGHQLAARAIVRDDVAAIRQTVQGVGLAPFSLLAGGDILFIDSSHILMPGTDVDILFNHVLPGLRRGV